VAKEKVPKERPPYRVGLRLLCALQLRTGTAELAALRQSSRYSALSLQCSTTQKGCRIKIKVKTFLVAPDTKEQHPDITTVKSAQAGIQNL